ncbi:hypothetical protein DSM104443_02280 [Usitatibacter rugosus]|uniref:Uncharacterized protein n=2 Tax=Usitatibacter rugosus TaxID=2732067 RepID=A0A6M4H067_9PROT|nr:hypothetical protein DSM104443_02280 [Usitatibacter rugosus]
MRDQRVIAWVSAVSILVVAAGAMFSVSLYIIIAGAVLWMIASFHYDFTSAQRTWQAPTLTWPQGIAVATGAALIIAGSLAAVLRYTIVLA